MFALFLSAGISKKVKFADLISKAKQSMEIRKAMVPNDQTLEEDVIPGKYEGPTYSYTVTKPLTGDMSCNILGYAQEDSHIAIIQARKPVDATEETVFLDSKAQKFFTLISLVESKDGVDVYQAKEVNPFEVVTSVKFSTTSDNKLGTLDFSKQLSKEVNCDWQTNGSPFNKGRPSSNLFNQYGLSLGAGFYGKAVLDIKAEIGMKSLDIDLGLNIKAIVGAQAGINNPSIQRRELFKFFTKLIPIPNYLSFSLLGYTFGIGTKLDVTLGIKDILFELAMQWNFYKGYIMDFNTGMKASTASGFSVVKPTITFQEVSDIDNIRTALEKATATLKFTPVLYLTLSLSFDVGKKQYSAVSLSLQPTIPFTFSFNRQLCPSPYLYGSITPYCDLVLNCDGLNVAGHRILNPFTKTWRIYNAGKYETCLFSKRSRNQIKVHRQKI